MRVDWDVLSRITSTPTLRSLYWELGELINEKQQASGWGDAVIDQIAKDLTRELRGIKGFSRRNLYYMRRFYRFRRLRSSSGHSARCS